MIKYYCDFCGKQMSCEEHKIDDKLCCDDCFKHLENQSWKETEDYKSLVKAREEITEYKNALTKLEKELNTKERVEYYLSRAYRNGMFRAINLLNNYIDYLNSINANRPIFCRNIANINKVEIPDKAETEVMDTALRLAERDLMEEYPYFSTAHFDYDFFSKYFGR